MNKKTIVDNIKIEINNIREKIDNIILMKLMIIFVVVFIATILILNIDSDSNKEDLSKTKSESKKVEVYAYIDFNVNTSIEIAIDKNKKVVDTYGFNDEGEYIIKNSNIMGLDIIKATEKIIGEMIEIGHINKSSLDSYILISGTLKKTNISKNDQENLTNLLKDILKTSVSYENAIKKADLIKFDYNLRSEANQKDISTGIFSIFKESEKQKKGLKLEDFMSEISNTISKIDISELLVLTYSKPNLDLKINHPEKNQIKQGENVSISVLSSDNTIKKIELFLNDKLKNSLNTAPYNFNLNNLDIGKYNLKVNIDFENGITETLSDKFDIVEFQGAEGQGTGLNGYYYDNKDLKGDPVMDRIDSVIDFEWEDEGPVQKKDEFSIKWIGFIEPAYSEEYTFFITSDDGCRLGIDNQMVIDDWTSHGEKEISGKLDMREAQKVSIQLNYFDDSSYSAVKLEWQSKSQQREVIPQKYLYINNN
ncbi:MAG: PA14 domain-containing protein [Clostridiales bacterium]